jgi:hypothetical protein
MQINREDSIVIDDKEWKVADLIGRPEEGRISRQTLDTLRLAMWGVGRKSRVAPDASEEEWEDFVVHHAEAFETEVGELAQTWWENREIDQ